MPNYSIEKRQAFDKWYLKVELKDNSHLGSVQNLLQELQSIKRANITNKKRDDLKVYPSKFFTIEETVTEVVLHLDKYFDSKPLDPIITKDKFSTISDIAYKQIVDEINIFGKNLEKYNDLHSKFDEENFRNFFLPHLNSISTKHSATGETFNKIGKTDILIQDQDGSNVFIAECKIWHGEKELRNAVDQLLERYVTWRDERVALIFFNKENKNFTELLITAKTAIKTYPLYKELIKENSDTSISYRFKNPEDEQKTIQLELIFFNCFAV